MKKDAPSGHPFPRHLHSQWLPSAERYFGCQPAYNTHYTHIHSTKSPNYPPTHTHPLTLLNSIDNNPRGNSSVTPRARGESHLHRKPIKAASLYLTSQFISIQKHTHTHAVTLLHECARRLTGAHKHTHKSRLFRISHAPTNDKPKHLSCSA